MPEVRVLAIHGCCLGDQPAERVSRGIKESTERALRTAGIGAEVHAPFYGDLLLAYARGEVLEFASASGLEAATDVAQLGGGREQYDEVFRQLAYELSGSSALEARLPIPDSVREFAMHNFMKDVATYLTMLRAKDAIWDLIADAWHEIDEGPDIVVAHSLGTVIMFDLLARRFDTLSRPTGLLMMGSPLYLGAVKEKVGALPGSGLNVGKWLHVYDDGDLIAGGMPISPAYRHATDFEVENRAFPTSHDYAGYVNAAARSGLFAQLT